MVVEKITQPN